MLPRHFKLGCLAIFMAPLVAFFIFLVITVAPTAWSTNRLASKRFVQARVVDADTKQPIENVVVLFDATYRTYRSGIMSYKAAGRRAYRARTDEMGVAKIPLEYFLVRGLRFDHVLLAISNVRGADLPEMYSIVALRDDYSTARVKIRKRGDEFPFLDPKQLPELELIQRHKLSRKQGTLYNTDVRFRNKFDADRIEFYYYLDPIEQRIARCSSVEDADFVVKYRKIPAGQGAIAHRLPTDDPLVEKVLSSIEAVGTAGVAIDPGAKFDFDQLGETEQLDFRASQLFENRLGHAPPFQVLIVQSRDGTQTAAIDARPNRISWLWSNPESNFRQARVYSGEAAKYCLDYGLTRDFDPLQKPDHAHWKKPSKPRPEHDLRMKFVPFKGFVPAAPGDAK